MAFEAAGAERWPESSALPVAYAMLDRVQHLLPQQGLGVERVEYAAEPTLHLAIRKVAVQNVAATLRPPSGGSGVAADDVASPTKVRAYRGARY